MELYVMQSLWDDYFPEHNLLKTYPGQGKDQ